MKRIIIVAALLTAMNTLRAQILTPVHWSYAGKRISKNKAVIFMKATIDDGWHIYSQTVKEGGPVKTSFTFTASDSYTLSGGTTEPKPVTKYEKVFSMDVSYFEHEAIFQQKITLKGAHAKVKGSIQFMTCNDHQCLPPQDVQFEVEVK